MCISNIAVYYSQSLHWNGWQEEEDNDVSNYKKCRFGFLFTQMYIFRTSCLFCFPIFYSFFFNPCQILTDMSYWSMRRWQKSHPFAGRRWFWLVHLEWADEVWRISCWCQTLSTTAPLSPVSRLWVYQAQFSLVWGFRLIPDANISSLYSERFLDAVKNVVLIC